MQATPMLLAAVTNGPDLTRYATVVSVLVICLAAVAYGLKRLLASGLSTRNAARALRVLDILPLGGRRQLAIVRCYDRTFALGLGEKEVSLVAELDSVEADPAEAARVAGKPATRGEGRRSLAPTLGELEPFEALLDEAHRRLAEKNKNSGNRLNVVVRDELEELVR